MNRSVLFAALALVFALAAPPPLLAQTQDEYTRVMQEYMARRAEWVALRRDALDQIKGAKDENEGQQRRAKLAEDEKPALARMGEAARAVQTAEQARRERADAARPRG